ncbi:MAG: preprotein translocase subunit SecA, partial [Chloroflexi bacterium]|nr:preprotein translocase subunit SecA [Chloroflexota bacterium]
IQSQVSYLYSPEPIEDARKGYEHLTEATRAEAYAADITYGTNNEFGFDYLRDNMAQTAAGRVQNQRHFAIVDEADSVLIDEARTPLIISGPDQQDISIYPRFARLVPSLQPEQDYEIDARTQAVTLTEAGTEKVERGLGIDNLYSLENFRLTRYMEAALKAQVIYRRDKDYVVKNGEVIIVDDFTGRLMEGRRWSDGLHQAVEAKEGVQVQQESVTYATITLQNFFRLYETLSGMTGTAVTEAEELNEIYKLEVFVVPPNRPNVRDDGADLVFRTSRGKWNAVVEEIVERYDRGQPMLVGTVAIETSEMLSERLTRRGVEHNVLNAKNHQREATIIEGAGQRGAVTIATNMAGRGTDIKLGEGVIELGGLHVIGTERHESRRIDNQLRGRAGRQGDPGSSRFFVSFGDDLMKRFSPEWVPNLLGKMGMDEDTPLESKMVSKAIEQAQTKVEGHNFDIRKHVVQYDDVMNRHRDLIYTERRKILEGVDLSENIAEMIEGEIESVFNTFLSDTDHDMWEVESLIAELKAIMPLPAKFTARHIRELDPEEGLNEMLEVAREAYEKKEEELGEDRMRTLERLLFLRVIDRLWVYHLTALDELRQGIGLRGYGQRDPLVEFKLEAHDMYDQLTEHISQDTVRQIYHVTLTAPVVRPQPPKQVSESGPDEDAASGATTTQVAAAASGGGGGTATVTAAPANRKVGRNAPCPCGSGKKYKKCHGGTGAV